MNAQQLISIIKTDNFNYKTRMKNTRNKDHIGLIYTTDAFKSAHDQRQCRPRAGSITGLTPKRISSVGKIISRPFTPKKTLSIQIQTTQIIPLMEAKGVQVQNLLQVKLDKQKKKQNVLMESTLKNNNNSHINKPGFLKVADFNAISQEASFLSKTIRKKCQIYYGRDNKQEKEQFKKIKTTEASEKHCRQFKSYVNPVPTVLQKQFDKVEKGKEAILRRHLDREGKEGREQKISKLSALYEKNLARYESSKVALVDLLREKQNKYK